MLIEYKQTSKQSYIYRCQEELQIEYNFASVKFLKNVATFFFGVVVRNITKKCISFKNHIKLLINLIFKIRKTHIQKTYSVGIKTKIYS